MSDDAVASSHDRHRLAHAQFRRHSVIVANPSGWRPLGAHGLRGARGITFTETMTAIALAIIVGALAVPSTAELLRQHRLVTAASQLGLDLMRARTIAISRSSEVRVALSSQGYVTQQRDVETGTWRNVGGSMSLPSIVTLSAASQAVEFTSTGTTVSNTIVLSNGSSKKLVEVSRIGRVKVS